MLVVSCISEFLKYMQDKHSLNLDNDRQELRFISEIAIVDFLSSKSSFMYFVKDEYKNKKWFHN